MPTMLSEGLVAFGMLGVGILALGIWRFVVALRTARPLPALTHETYSTFQGVAKEAPPFFRGFAWKFSATFALLSASVLLLARWLLPAFESLQRRFGSWEAWPGAWSGVPISDFVYLEFLALFATLVIVVGLQFSATRLSIAGRVRPTLFLLGYSAAAAAFDAAVAPLHPELAYSIIARVLLGASFFLVAFLGVLALPAPIRIVPKHLDRRVGATFVVCLLGGVVTSYLVVAVLFGPVWAAARDPLLAAAYLLLLPTVAVVFFGAYGLIAYLLIERKEARSWGDPATFRPPVTVIIPAYNEEASLPETLRQLDRAAADYPGPIDVVVGNDGSLDRTSEVGRATFAELHNLRGRVLDLPHGGKSSALNAALLAATGDVVVRMDADTTAVRLAPIIRYFTDPAIGEVQGIVIPARRHGWIARLRLLELMWNEAFLRRALMATGTAQVLSGNFSAFRRDRLLEIGGWVPWNGEDAEISIRLLRLGYRLRLDTRSLAYEDTPSSFPSLTRQRIRWVRGGYFSHAYHFEGFLAGLSLGAPAMFLWLWWSLRGARRYLIYIFAALLSVTYLPHDLVHVLLLVGLLLLPRILVVAGFLVRWGFRSALPWAPLWPAFSLLKSYFSLEAVGTMLPGNNPEFSD